MHHDARARPRNDGRSPKRGSCRPSVRGRQLRLPAMSAWRSWRPDHVTRTQSTWTWVAAALLVGLALPGCQEMGDDRATASSDPAPVATAPAEAGYPPLQSVPPRPQLSYTVQQQRQIVEALIADRENARYTGQVVRHRSGLSSLPPPPTPPEPAPPVDLDARRSPRPAPEPSLAEQETLVDFLGALLFDAPAAAPGGEPAAERASEPEEPRRGGATGRCRDPPSDETTRQAPTAAGQKRRCGPDGRGPRPDRCAGRRERAAGAAAAGAVRARRPPRGRGADRAN